MAGDGLTTLDDDGGARLTGTPPSSGSGRSGAPPRSLNARGASSSVRENAGANPREETPAPGGPPSTTALPQAAGAATPASEAPGAARRQPKDPGADTGTPVAIPVPERPRLAPEIELVGEMVESAFKDPPWLISREGRYIQVSRLLYVVAEQCDGKRRLEEIARAVSEAIKRGVEPDDVKVIVGNLMRSGIVALPDGYEAAVQAAGANASSALALNMKMRMLSPRMIDPVTALVQFLYWPPILVLALGVAAAAEVWVYLSHGVGDAIHAAFYTPGLMLAVFGFVVLAAAFHELGHAAALRYGGARARAMGVGLYIVYPAFYTDVTENYRLPRWARLRTDLGGFYFNLLFIMGLLAIYRLTGLEFLILIVVILNLEIIHQTLPFVRLDGYWALADITGIPDFFSQLVPFLRAHLPRWVPLPDGARLPELKTWGKFAFGAYILITIPLLLFLLFTMIRAAPRIIATAWDALFVQFGTIGKSFGAGDVVMVLAAAAQVLALALPLLGIVFTLFTVARRLFGAIWRWSQPTPARRVAGLVASAAIVAGIALLWAPQLPLPGAPPGPLYAATAPFVPIQANEPLTLADLVTTQGSLAKPGVRVGAPAGPGEPAGTVPGASASSQPSTSPAPSALTSPSPAPSLGASPVTSGSPAAGAASAAPNGSAAPGSSLPCPSSSALPASPAATAPPSPSPGVCP